MDGNHGEVFMIIVSKGNCNIPKINLNTCTVKPVIYGHCFGRPPAF